ncbi:hypothetical protein [Pseudomonas protegens]
MLGKLQGKEQEDLFNDFVRAFGLAGFHSFVDRLWNQRNAIFCIKVFAHSHQYKDDILLVLASIRNNRWLRLHVREQAHTFISAVSGSKEEVEARRSLIAITDLICEFAQDDETLETLEMYLE